MPVKSCTTGSCPLPKSKTGAKKAAPKKKKVEPKKKKAAPKKRASKQDDSSDCSCSDCADCSCSDCCSGYSCDESFTSVSSGECNLDRKAKPKKQPKTKTSGKANKKKPTNAPKRAPKKASTKKMPGCSESSDCPL